MKSNHWIGRKHTEASKKKQSLAKLGKPGPWAGKKRPSPSKETREKMSRAHIGRRHTPETRRQMSEARRGPLGPRWQGGLVAINLIIRKSVEYKLWREAVFKRDGYACIWGGKAHGNKLHADHIKPFAFFPELRFAIDNGRTLCVECHKTTETYGKNVCK